MKSIQSYNDSHIDEQATVLWDKASFIGYYYNPMGKTVGLYSLHTFYVELVYDNFREEIRKLIAISVDDALNKYLRQIDV